MSIQACSSEFWSSLALKYTQGLGNRTWKNLLEYFGSASKAVECASEWNNLDFTGPKAVEHFHRGNWREKAWTEWDDCHRLGLNVLLYTDSAYPEYLRQIFDPPLFLYYSGDIDLMSCPCLAVVGSRKCSEYGLRICARIVQDLSKAGITIVSGFALGIDRKAHIAAFSGQGSSIAVLGTGLDTVYPARNRDLWGKLCRSGLVVTEFAPRVKPEAHHFPRRNRIISGLSLGVLVVEGSKNSGSLITAGCALEQGREVFAVPGPLQGENFSGCHHLIRQGGTLVTSAQDIMDELEWSIKALYPHSSAAVDYYAHKDAAVGTANKNIKHDWQDLNADELQLVQIMQKQARLHIDVLAGQVGWDSNRLSSTLLMLEMKGVVKQITGMYYALEN